MKLTDEQADRSATRSSDLPRAVALVTVAAAQMVAGAIGGAGGLGEPVGEVANSYPTVLLPAGAAFSIWSLIYVTFAALAVRQALPRQRSRLMYRRSGWWLVGAGALNTTWVVFFVYRQIAVSQIVIIALLVCLAVAAWRLSGTPAAGWSDRLLVHVPVMLYLGWVSIATVAGAATTMAALAEPPSASVAVVALAVTVVALAGAILRFSAGVGFAAAAAWALIWIAVGTESDVVRIAAGVAALATVAVLGVRLARAADRATAAWG